MAYNLENLTKLAALKALSERIKQDYATRESVETLSGRVDELVTSGGEPNVITAVKVNGAAQTITDKAVDIEVPTKVSELNNDSKFQSDAQVAAAVAQAIAASGHARFENVATVPAADAAQENVLYLVMNSETNHYDIYAKIGATVELLDDTTVDLSGYVQKEEGKGLSANDYTTAEKGKLSGIATGATKVEASATNGNIKVNGVETAVYTEPEDVPHGSIATTAEVAEMLNEVFAADQTA